MTAEVAVLNRVGVALAADSAVTVGRTANKIWTSADKLFELSEVDPIAIMIYGNADHVGIPWETVIKCYRRKHGLEHHERVLDHATTFFAFLTNNAELFPPQAEARRLEIQVASFLLSFRDQMRGVLDREAEASNGLDVMDVAKLYDREILALLRGLRARPALEGFPVSRRAKIRQFLGNRLPEIRDEVFGNLPLTPKASRGLLFAALLMLTRYLFGPQKSGVVFAGFGEREFLPSLVSFEIDGMVCGDLRRARGKETQITDTNGAAIVPFAQQEMVRAFMEGVDPDLAAFVLKSTDDAFSEGFGKVLELVEALEPSLSTHVRSLVPQLGELVRALRDDLTGAQTRYAEPVINNIASLPKDELAAMAEAFVNLTKFRRRVTIERETVGGPIDVAVVTKGDGFIWVRRKHYFDPALNPRYMAKLRR